MSRISEAFAKCREEGRKAFIPFLAAGDPDLQITEAALQILDVAGADIIELGIPFSDPVADGPVIQASYQRALANRVSLKRTLQHVRRLRLRAPLLLFTYLNPLLQLGLKLGAAGCKPQVPDPRSKIAEARSYFLADPSQGACQPRPCDLRPGIWDLGLKEGLDQLAKNAVEAGFAGVLISDLTPEEAALYQPPFRSRAIDTVFLVAPTTTESRLQKILACCSGFLYLIARTGVTGKQTVLSASVREQIHRIRKHSRLPIAVGFGMRTPEDVRRGSAMADGVVVGSAIVERLHRLAGRKGWEQKFEGYISGFVDAAHN